MFWSQTGENTVMAAPHVVSWSFSDVAVSGMFVLNFHSQSGILDYKSMYMIS